MQLVFLHLCQPKPSLLLLFLIAFMRNLCKNVNLQGALQTDQACSLLQKKKKNNKPKPDQNNKRSISIKKIIIKQLQETAKFLMSNW